MTDLLAILPDFPAHYHNLLPSLERNLLTTADLLVLDAVEVAKRTQLPVGDVCALTQALIEALHDQLHTRPSVDQLDDAAAAKEGVAAVKAVNGDALRKWETVSTLDDELDAALGGGIPTGYIVEITGESGAGKTQFLLTLLLAVQLSPPHGLDRAALYISTESPLPTARLSQILSTHPHLNALAPAERPSLSRILSIQTQDLESQDHILRYQLPVAIERHRVGLVVLDSVAANFRAEFDPLTGAKRAVAMARRSAELVRLGAVLRDIARTFNVVLVVTNQVADRFSPVTARSSEAVVLSRDGRDEQTLEAKLSPQPPPLSASTPPSPPAAHLDTRHAFVNGGTSAFANASTAETLTLDHQQRWFTGWGDLPPASRTTLRAESLKTPSLGLTWTNQISCRIALIKAPLYADRVDASRDESRARDGESPDLVKWRRWMRLVFAPWAMPTGYHAGIEFDILDKGIQSVNSRS